MLEAFQDRPDAANAQTLTIQDVRFAATSIVPPASHRTTPNQPVATQERITQPTRMRLVQIQTEPIQTESIRTLRTPTQLILT